MVIKLKKRHKDAVTPTRAHWDDAGFDMTCVSKEETDKFIQYNTGLSMEIPYGYVGLLFPRSGVTKKDMMLKNSIGVIDAGYRGEISFRFLKVIGTEKFVQLPLFDSQGNPTEFVNEGYVFKYIPREEQQIYNVGDEIGQIIFLKLPEIEFEEVDKLEDSERGEGKYGSTDKDKPKPPAPPKARVIREGEAPEPPPQY